MQAQARAMSADERALNRVSSAASNFPDLGLPPRKYFLRKPRVIFSFINELITPVSIGRYI